MTVQARPAPANQTGGRFGTFAGVFTPNILTILGIILFLRIGWVVGQTGLWGALIIIALANLISLLTGLSLSAVATSMRVRAGGNYYLISRSLGLEVGGAVGIPLYLSQAISVAFYIIGFTEALLTLEIFQGFNPQLISTVVILVFCVIAYIGADFALKIQYVILAILIAALASFFAGGWGEFISPNLTSNYTPGVTFWVAFAVFFPAVTGIEVGTSLSGDLKNPSYSIPVGTIASILITAVIYFLVAIWFAFHSTPDQLISDNLAMQRIAVWPILILAGVWASTLSSALGSVLSAPRTLQAIARDAVVPKWMAAQLGSPTEPRLAVLLTGVVAIAVIWVGDLNFVAPIISMFFLNTYGMVNLVAGIEKLVGNPSFRPRFRIPWVVSLLGAIGCYAVMFLISPIATIIAIVITYGIFFYLQQRQIKRTWGDVRSGIWFAISRYVILNLEKQRRHAKNWRPNLMVFTGQPHNRQQLAEVAEWLSLGQGIVTFFQLIVGEVDKLVGRGLRTTARNGIQKYIEGKRMTALAEAEIVPDFKQGAITIAQAHGFGGLETNSILMGWSGTPEGRTTQIDLTRTLSALEKSVLLLHDDEERGFGQRETINVWWGGQGGNADLMLLLAYLIKQHPTWTNAKIQLLRIIDGEEGTTQTKAHLEQLLRDVRVDAEPVVITRPADRSPVTKIISDRSQTADLTLLGMQVQKAEDCPAYGHFLNELVESVGAVLLVRNAQGDENLLSTG